MLVPLHVKSHYSLGCGSTSVEKIVERAAAVGLEALGLTDTENLYGQVVFHRAAHGKGLHPITGVELYAAPRRLVLLARNRAGYENLCRIVTRRKLPSPSGGSVPGDTEILQGLCEGLFILVEDPGMLDRILCLDGVERGSVRLLLVRPGVGAAAERRIVEASARQGVPLVADPDVVFLDPEDRILHQLQLAIARNTLISRVEEEGLLPPRGRHFPGPRECAALFQDVPGAVEETRRIAGACDLILTGARPIFPRIPLPAGETAYSHLAKLSFRGLETRVARITPRYLERLSSELKIIEQLGFCEYFLVVGDIIRFAHQQGIEVVGRGSGAGSLVAHVLGVTNVDPVEYGLYFERFLHPGRTDLPDIDIDICWIRRDEVIEHVYETFGRDRVAMISSHVTFQPHLAFRETVKAFGFPMEEVNTYSRAIPYTHGAVDSKSPLRDLIVSSGRARRIPLEEESMQTAISLAERLLRQPRHLSVHPGGIVIADRPIEAYVPLERAAKGIVVTQYDMYSIEELGLVKIDLLGNRCLTELQETIEIAMAQGEHETEGDGAPPPSTVTVPTLAGIPDADPATIDLLQNARTIGCFQLESPAMRGLLAKLRVRDVRDCIRAVAIIRPGAAAGGAKDAYIRRRDGEEPPSYLHPSLRKILQESLGVVLYEEDVMCIAAAIAGMSLAEGDRLRSAIKKCRHPDDAREIENDFLRRAVQGGVEPDIAAAVWKDLRKFAGYCFSKAHAAGYGLLAYQSAYLKTHFPVAFGCAILNNHAGMYTTRTIAEEVRRMGVTILPPCANRSELRFCVERTAVASAIRTGLGRIKGLSSAAIEKILAERRRGGPFRNLADFLRRVHLARREAETLILAGAFDGIASPEGGLAAGISSPPAGESLKDCGGPNHPQLLWELEVRMGPGGRPAAREEAGRGPMLLDGDRLPYPPLPPYDAMTRLRHELEILEMGISDHPMRLLREDAVRRGCLTTVEAMKRPGRRVRVAGLLAATRSVRTSGGRTMRFLTIEDEHGLLESTLFPRAHAIFSSRIGPLGPYIVEGTVEEDHRAVNLNVSRLERWTRRGDGPLSPLLSETSRAGLARHLPPGPAARHTST